MEAAPSKHPEVIKAIDAAAEKMGFTDTDILQQLKAAVELQPPARTGDAQTELKVRAMSAKASHTSGVSAKLGGSVLDPLFNALLQNRELAAKMGLDCSRKVSAKRLKSKGTPLITGIIAIHALNPEHSAVFVKTDAKPNLLETVTKNFGRDRLS